MYNGDYCCTCYSPSMNYVPVNHYSAMSTQTPVTCTISYGRPFVTGSPLCNCCYAQAACCGQGGCSPGGCCC